MYGKFTSQKTTKRPLWGRKSKETKKAISSALKERYSKFPHHNKGKSGKLSPQYGKGGKAIYVYDIETKDFLFLWKRFLLQIRHEKS
jgi:hypothetical protein